MSSYIVRILGRSDREFTVELLVDVLGVESDGELLACREGLDRAQTERNKGGNPFTW